MGKNRNHKHNTGHALFGVGSVTQHPMAQTLARGGLVLLAAIASGGIGAAFGRHSLLAGIPITLYGFHKKNTYIIAAGLGLTLSNGFQSPMKKTVQGIDGFDLKQLAQEAKDRVGTFFKNFSEKLYIAKDGEPSATAGLAGENDEQVSYFVNPHGDTNELDMSAIDRLQERIASMNSGINAIEDIEREF